MQTWRYLFAVVSVLFVAGVVVQVFLAGVGLPGLGAGTMQGHIDFGYLLALVPVLPLLLSWPARAGGRTAILCVALLLTAQIQTFLPLASDGAPLVAALHPVNALVLFGLGLMVARQGVALARAGDVAIAHEASARSTQRA
jgi:hypothetical protein